ncbi:MAG: alkaline phosphatase family protein [Acidimicrobiaceae bacterium]|nr:alkaline phosphatase family protein [Acidimicrobiaceae bacterium]MXW61549.1 alkaline phosphatase family protein [Acidimicrobiaceae bacterium]MXW75531.1 alkaline phosphatase family protein [Acidimicrobiaceae bacterium]MYA73187.1 alkaline phosphatase family protein [Acidimicrobiaceae bacterium]MYC42193.1 alkaline phosphatase family protein [Acidimicrobiaceae bacterium]
MHEPEPMMPAFGGGCIADLVPALLERTLPADSLLDEAILDSNAVVMLLLDGLGWNQLQQRAHLAPTLMSMTQRTATTVAPSTTATALTSLVTGSAPGRHGVVGYRIHVNGEVLNTLRWSTPSGDARKRILPSEFQLEPAFCGQRPVVVQNAEFGHSGFTMAHLADVRHRGWQTMPAIAVEVRQAIADGEPFVYAYYDGIDKTAHLRGFGEFYDAELVACDNMVADLMMALPRGTAIVVTADHGLVDCLGNATALAPEVTEHVRSQSGEARFRWLHSEPGRQRQLLTAAVSSHSDRAWVYGVEEMIDEGWFGPEVTDAARSRLGDVALVAKDRWYFTDPADSPRIELVGRHGSLTPDEMLIPVLTFTS